MRLTDPTEVRASIAAHVLGSAPGCRVLGAVTLHKHQCDAVERLRAILRKSGGALLADEVGLGKTFVALALASEFERPVVVAPAALRHMWRTSAARSGVALRFVSMERLGYGGTVPTTDLIVVDEAHHFRNRGTRRYARLADACARASVLLLTATPVQNSIEDLRHLLALIIGREADVLKAEELGKLIVRRGADSLAGVGATLPTVAPPRWITVAPDVDCLDQLCELPPPVPPSDGACSQTLLTFSLARQWASSRAAFIAALTRRLAMAAALDDALACGKRLSRSELAAWRFADGAQQLAFPELATGFSAATTNMRDQLRLHADAVRSLIARLRHQPDVDRSRAEQLLAIIGRHPGERVVAFAEFSETVTALYRHLMPVHRTAMLTHGGGRVAGGPVRRDEVLAQFGSSGTVPESARIDLLLTTDVLSEGVDLQGASVVVHLDLTWNPGRMEQRVGRLRRIGAARDSIAVYLFEPPAPAERLLQLDRRLRDKLGEAARSVGVAGTILPGFAPSAAAAVHRRERTVAVLQSWLRPVAGSGKPVAAAVACACSAVVACVRSGGDVMLVALRNGCVEDDVGPELLLEIANGHPVECAPAAIAGVRKHLDQWLERRTLTDLVQFPVTELARARRLIITRIDGIARRARRHERSVLGAMLGAARQSATMTMPVGAERVLGELARAPLPDEAWLRAIGEFGSIHGRQHASQPDEVLALLLLVPTVSSAIRR